MASRKKPRRSLSTGGVSAFEWAPLQRVKDAANGAEVWKNSRFTVVKQWAPTGLPAPDSTPENPKPLMVIHLMVQSPADVPATWSELQMVKDAVCGLECEGLQLHPSHHRVVKTGHYHLWVFPKGMSLDIGLNVREREEKTLGG